MKAILLTTIVAEVDDEEAAATLAIGMDKAARMNMASALEQHDISEAEAAAVVAYLGVQVMIVPEEITA